MKQHNNIAAILFGLFLSLSVPGAAWAATYYVATNGSDSNNGSQASPFRTVQKAVGVVRAGDTVVIKPGRYPAFSLNDINGAAGSPITFFGEPGAVIDSYLGGAFRPIDIYGGSYLTFDGLELTDSGPLPTSGGCDTPRDPRRWGKNGIKLNKGGSSRTYPHHLVFKNLDIHRMPSQAILGTADDSQFLSNRVHDNGHRPALEQAYGTYLKGKRWLIRGNRIYNNSGNGIRTGNDTSAGTTELLVDSIIEKNLIYDNGGRFRHTNANTGVCRIVDAGDGIVIWHGSGNMIRNNILYNNNGYGIRVNEDTAVSNTPNVVYNNTVYKSGSVGIYAYAGENTIVKNNISYLNTAQPISGGVQVSNNLTTDPRFVNASGGDFHVQAGSPAIDAGQTLAEVADDFDGGARPAGAAYDIGAYESGALPRVCSVPGTAVAVPTSVIDPSTGRPPTRPGYVLLGVVPPGFTLSAGTLDQSVSGGSVYRLTLAQLSGLTLTPPADFKGTVKIEVFFVPQ